MRLRATSFATAATLATVLSPLGGCTSPQEPGSGNTGGIATGGSTGGLSSGGSSGGSTGGFNTAGSAGSTAGGGNGGEAIPATFETVRLVVTGTNPQCGAAPCHGVGGMAPPGRPLTLADNAQLYTNLTSYTSKACGNVPLINLSNPADSGLIKILKGPCGATPRMPYDCKEQDGTCVPDEYIAAIQQWIAKGAPKQ